MAPAAAAEEAPPPGRSTRSRRKAAPTAAKVDAEAETEAEAEVEVEAEMEAPAGRRTRGRTKAAAAAKGRGKGKAKKPESAPEVEPDQEVKGNAEAETVTQETKGRGRTRGAAAKKEPAQRGRARTRGAKAVLATEEVEEENSQIPSTRQTRAGRRRTEARDRAASGALDEEAEAVDEPHVPSAARATRRMTRARAEEPRPAGDTEAAVATTAMATGAGANEVEAEPLPEKPQELVSAVASAAPADPGPKDPKEAAPAQPEAPSRRRTRAQADMEPDIEALAPETAMKPAKTARRRRTRVDLMAAAALAAEEEEERPDAAAPSAAAAAASNSPVIPCEAQPAVAKEPRRKTTHQTAAFNFQPEPANQARAAAAEAAAAAAAVKKKPVTDLVEAALMDPGALLSSRGAVAKSRATELMRTPGPGPASAAGTAEKAGKLSLTTPRTEDEVGAAGGGKGVKSVTPDEMAHTTMHSTEIETKTVLEKARGGGLRNMADLLKPKSKPARPHATPGPSPLVAGSAGTITAPAALTGSHRAGALLTGSNKTPFQLKSSSSAKPALVADEGRRTPGVKANPALTASHALHREEVMKRKRALEEQQREEWLRQQEEKRRRVEGNLAAMEAKDRAKREARALAERERKAGAARTPGTGAKRLVGGLAKTPGSRPLGGASRVASTDKENVALHHAAPAGAAKWTQGFGQGAPAPAKKAFPVVSKAALSTPVSSQVTANAVAKAPVVESYDMSPYRGSDDEDDAEYAPQKVVPLWAQRQNLLQQIQRQAYTNPDKIFQTKQTSCSLDEVFGNGHKSRLWNKARGSSGDWAADEVTAAEEMNYEKAMGFLSAR